MSVRIAPFAVSVKGEKGKKGAVAPFFAPSKERRKKDGVLNLIRELKLEPKRGAKPYAIHKKDRKGG